MLDWNQCPAVERVPGKVSGAWVFKGTRVPVKALFENLEDGARLDDSWHGSRASDAIRPKPFCGMQRIGVSRFDGRLKTCNGGRIWPAENFLTINDVAVSPIAIGWLCKSNLDVLIVSSGQLKTAIGQIENLRCDHQSDIAKEPCGP